jgi:hypothetical protein
MKVTQQLEQQILDFNEEQRSNRYIAKQLNIARSTIKNVLDKHGRKTHKSHIRLERKDGQLKCLECQDFKDEKLFYNSVNRPACGTCKECRTSKRRNKRKTSVENFFQYKWRTTRDRALKLKVAFDLTVEDLIKQYHKQNGICFYTEEPFAPFDSTRDRNTLSVDKVNPAQGYTKDNIVLCTFKVNTAKGNFTLEEMDKWMPEWAKRIRSLD